jgi:hypothetical protein
MKTYIIPTSRRDFSIIAENGKTILSNIPSRLEAEIIKAGLPS